MVRVVLGIAAFVVVMLIGLFLALPAFLIIATPIVAVFAAVFS